MVGGFHGMRSLGVCHAEADGLGPLAEHVSERIDPRRTGRGKLRLNWSCSINTHPLGGKVSRKQKKKNAVEAITHHMDTVCVCVYFQGHPEKYILLGGVKGSLRTLLSDTSPLPFRLPLPPLLFPRSPRSHTSRRSPQALSVLN